MRFYLSCSMWAIWICSALGGASSAMAAEQSLKSPYEMLAMVHAKVTCSNQFISGIGAERTAKEDLLGFGASETVVDLNGQRVTSQMNGVAETAVFSAKTGCTPVVGITEGALHKRRAKLYAKLRALHYADAPLDSSFDKTNVDYKLLSDAVNSSFQESDEGSKKNTRAIIVMHNGKIVAERYAAGITQETALSGFSMSKSVLNAIIGILIERKIIAGVTHPLALEEWHSPDDPRSSITYEHLMRMTAGLVWDEDYANPMSDVLVSLMGAYNSSGIAVSRPVYMASNQYYSYSSGNTQILSLGVRRALKKTGLNAEVFPYKELFVPLGMKTAQIEMDSAGNHVYAASVYASARDWARFGQFLLEGGRVSGRQLLPEGWINYSTMGSKLSNYQKGALFSVNQGTYPSWPSLPVDTYAAIGFRGQRLVVIPSKSLVIVRLGASVPEGAWDFEKFAATAVQAVSGADNIAMNK